MVPVLLAPPPWANAEPANANAATRASRPFFQTFICLPPVGARRVLQSHRAGQAASIQITRTTSKRHVDEMSGRAPYPDGLVAGRTRRCADATYYNDLQLPKKVTAAWGGM